MPDTTQTIFRSAARFFSGTMLSRITGMLRDIALAYAFGTQSAVAALLLAFRFAHLLRRLLGEGAMQTAIIPHFEDLRKENPQRAGRFFCDLAMSLSKFLLLIIAVVMSGICGLLFLNFLSPGNAEIAWLTLLMMPSLLFICLFGINASLLQCEKNFFVSSAAPVVFNLFWIIGILCTQKLIPTTAMSFLSFFVVLACFAQWAITLPKTCSILKSYGITTFWSKKNLSHDVIRLAKPLTLGIVGVGASQINNALDGIFARWASDEGPALLWYAIRLQQLPLALFGVAIAGALLPPLARTIKAGDFSKFRFFLDFSLRRSIAVMLPITALLFLMGGNCINYIYGRGDFSAVSVIGTTHALWGYSVGLIPMALVMVIAPAFYAKGDYRTPSTASVASVFVNVFLNSLFVAVFEWGVTSVALATSISSWINLLWLGIALKKMDASHESHMTSNLVPMFSKTFIATCLASIAVIASDIFFLGNSTAIEIMNHTPPLFHLSFFLQTVHLVASGIIFLIIFGFASWIFGAKDITHFASTSV